MGNHVYVVMGHCDPSVREVSSWPVAVFSESSFAIQRIHELRDMFAEVKRNEDNLSYEPDAERWQDRDHEAWDLVHDGEGYSLEWDWCPFLLDA